MLLPDNQHLPICSNAGIRAVLCNKKSTSKKKYEKNVRVILLQLIWSIWKKISSRKKTTSIFFCIKRLLVAYELFPFKKLVQFQCWWQSNLWARPIFGSTRPEPVHSSVLVSWSRQILGHTIHSLSTDTSNPGRTWTASWWHRDKRIEGMTERVHNKRKKRKSRGDEDGWMWMHVDECGACTEHKHSKLTLNMYNVWYTRAFYRNDQVV